MNLNSLNSSEVTGSTWGDRVSVCAAIRSDIPMSQTASRQFDSATFLLSFFLVILFSCAAVGVQAEENFAAEGWELDRDRDDVRVYLKKIPGSKYKAYRGVTEMEATLGSVVSIFMDIERMPNWMHELEQASVLKQKDAANRYLYMVNRAPFPIKDRDFIVGYNFKQNPKDLKVKISIENAPHLHQKTKYTHMKIVEGYYSVEPLESGRVRVMYECHLDPGGRVPSWAANIVISDTPFYTLKNLREQVEQRGNDLVLPYVTELNLKDATSVSMIP